MFLQQKIAATLRSWQFLGTTLSLYTFFVQWPSAVSETFQQRPNDPAKAKNSTLQAKNFVAHKRWNFRSAHQTMARVNLCSTPFPNHRALVGILDFTLTLLTQTSVRTNSATSCFNDPFRSAPYAPHTPYSSTDARI